MWSVKNLSGCEMHKKISLISLIFIMSFAIFHSQQVFGAQASKTIEIYNLGSGDKVRITVFGHTDLSGEFLVDDTGIISMPLIGSVKSGGLTIRELEKTIIAKLKDGYLVNPSVNVEVVKFRPFYIIGEVARPGSYPYISGMTVFNAVALAGGFTSRAKKSEVLISRGGGKAKEVKLKSETFVMPGDIIEIPERFF